MNNNTDYYHKQYLWRCLQLAQKGIGLVAPNPMVGAIVVHQNRIIGEGWHQQYGQAHAERNAIANIDPKDKHLLPEATLYVNLEPCAHYGKTPPCADFIIECGIKRVVVGCGDPFLQVAGKGIEKLNKAGVEVITHLLNKESEWFNRRFITFQQQQRPYIILKWAQTQNAYFAPNNQTQQWISNQQAKMVSHQWRTEESAIMIGTNTAIIDNPQLNARLWQGKQPIRLLIDRHLSLPKHLHLFNNSQKTLVFTEKNANKLPETTQKHLPFSTHTHKHPKDNTNNQLQIISLDPQPDLLPQIWQYLYQQNIQSVIVEGGAALLNSIIKNNTWDEARLFIAPTIWQSGIYAPTLPSSAQLIEQYNIGNNLLKIITNPTR